MVGTDIRYHGRTDNMCRTERFLCTTNCVNGCPEPNCMSFHYNHSEFWHTLPGHVQKITGPPPAILEKREGSLEFFCCLLSSAIQNLCAQLQPVYLAENQQQQLLEILASSKMHQATRLIYCSSDKSFAMPWINGLPMTTCLPSRQQGACLSHMNMMRMTGTAVFLHRYQGAEDESRGSVDQWSKNSVAEATNSCLYSMQLCFTSSCVTHNGVGGCQLVFEIISLPLRILLSLMLSLIQIASISCRFPSPPLNCAADYRSCAVPPFWSNLRSFQLVFDIFYPVVASPFYLFTDFATASHNRLRTSCLLQ